MNKFLALMALGAATIAAPAATVMAQTLPPAVIIVCDMDRVFSTSAAGKAAQTELQTKLAAIQSRVGSLRTSFGTEEQELAKTRPTAPGPAATAWEAKAKDFATRRQQAEAELQRRNEEFQASRQYVLKQINDGAQPIITAVMKERGATIALAEAATLQHTASVDVTADVVARLDKALPRVSTTAPAAPAGAAAPR